MSDLSTAVDTLANKLEADDLKIVWPLVDGYATNVIAANGDLPTIASQSKLLFDQLQAAGLQVAKTDITDIFTAVKTLGDAQVALLLNPPAPPPATASTPTPTGS